MRKINFKHIFQHGETGRTVIQFHSLEKLEENGISPLHGYSTVARLLGSGVKDKKGNEIFEGDWVLALIGDYGSHFYCQVFYDEKIAAFSLFGKISENITFDRMIECEVLGNIYEYPTLTDLMKGVK